MPLHERYARQVHLILSVLPDIAREDGFLQLADIVVYMAGRYLARAEVPEKWHDIQVFKMW